MFERLIQNYLAFSDECGGVDRLPVRPMGVKLTAAGAQFGQESDVDRPTFQSEPLLYRLNGPVEAGLAP